MVTKTRQQASDDWFVYMVECGDGSYYTGVAKDVHRRVDEHNHSNARAAKYTRTRRPVTLIWSEGHIDRSSACRREWEIKRLTRTQKQALLDRN